MEWIVNSLAKVFLKILDGLTSFSTNLVGDFKLTIGYKEGSGIWDAITQPWSVQDSLFEKTLPGAATFTTIFWVMGLSIVFLITVLKLFQALGGPFTQSEEPGIIAGRSILAGCGVIWSYTIFVVFERFFNQFYSMFLDKYNDQVKGATNYTYDSKTLVTKAIENGQSEKQALLNKGFWTDFVGNTSFGDNIGVTILIVIIGIFLIWNFLKLLLEMYERYVMIGVLFYTSPLAFSTLVSKASTVWKSWLMMVVSEFILMCSNLFFLGTFVNAWNNILGKPSGGKDVIFDSPQDFITTMFILTAWLIIGQKMDTYMKGLGLSTAQTGDSLGGALLSTMAIGGTIGGVIGAVGSGAGKVLTGKDPISNLKNSDSAIGRGIRSFSPDKEGGVGSGSTLKQAKEDLAGFRNISGSRAVDAALKGTGADLSRTGLGQLDPSRCTAGNGVAHLEDINGKSYDIAPAGSHRFTDNNGNPVPTMAVPGTNGKYETPLTESAIGSWQEKTISDMSRKYPKKDGYSVDYDGHDIVVRSRRGEVARESMPELQGFHGKLNLKK